MGYDRQDLLVDRVKEPLDGTSSNPLQLLNMFVEEPDFVSWIECRQPNVCNLHIRKRRQGHICYMS